MALRMKFKLQDQIDYQFVLFGITILVLLSFIYIYSSPRVLAGCSGECTTCCGGSCSNCGGAAGCSCACCSGNPEDVCGATKSGWLVESYDGSCVCAACGGGGGCKCKKPKSMDVSGLEPGNTWDFSNLRFEVYGRTPGVPIMLDGAYAGGVALKNSSFEGRTSSWVLSDAGDWSNGGDDGETKSWWALYEGWGPKDGDWLLDAHGDVTFSIHQNIDYSFQPNKTYDFAIWYRSRTGKAFNGTLAVWGTGGSAPNRWLCSDSFATSSGDKEWHKVSCSFTTPDTVGSTGEGYVALNQNTTVALDWPGVTGWGKNCDHSDEERHYEVRVRESGGDWNEPASCTNPRQTSCEVSNLKSCTEYDWKVKAHNGCKGGGWSKVQKFKTNCGPTIDKVQVSDGSKADWNCNAFKNRTSCESNADHKLCSWNADEGKCQLYLSKNGDHQEVDVITTYSDEDGANEIKQLAYALEDSDNKLGAQDRKYYESYVKLDRKSSDVNHWVIRGQYKDDDADALCHCGLVEDIHKNCDEAGYNCSQFNGSLTDCDLNSNCGWNYAEEYCQPVGCTGWRAYHWGIPRGKGDLPVYLYGITYWSVGRAFTANAPICSNKTPAVDYAQMVRNLDRSALQECDSGDGHLSAVAKDRSLSGKRLTTTMNYKVISESSSQKLYLYEHAADTSGDYQWGANSGCPSAESPKVCWSWSRIRHTNLHDGYNVCDRKVGPYDSPPYWWCNTDPYSCGSECWDDDFELYVDNSKPYGDDVDNPYEKAYEGIADRVKVSFKTGDSSFGGDNDGGGLKEGEDGIKNIKYCEKKSGNCTNSDWKLVSSIGGLDFVKRDIDHKSGSHETKSYFVVNGLRDGYTYKFKYTAEDLAGNTKEIDIMSTLNVGAPWFSTKDGDIYSKGNIRSLIPQGDLNYDYFLSTYLVSTGNEVTAPIDNFRTTDIGQFLLEEYMDGNNKAWYQELLNLAKFNTGSINEVSISDLNIGDRGDGVYEVDSLTISGTCRGKKAIFVKNNLIVSKEITSLADSACLFVVGGNLTIQHLGNSTGDKNADGMEDDVIQAAFIVDGDVIIEEDTNNFEQLYLEGFIFSAGNIDLSRGLVLSDNEKYPAEFFQYDPKYLVLMNEYLGRRKVENYSCGVVDRSECIGN